MVDEIPYTPPGAPAAPVAITPATTSAPTPTEFQQGTVTPAAPAAIGVSSATPSAPTAIGSSAATPVVPDGLDTGAPPEASDPATTKMDKVSAGDADELLATTTAGNAKRSGILKSVITGLVTKVQSLIAGTAGRIVALDASGNAYPTGLTVGSLEEQFAAKVDMPFQGTWPEEGSYLISINSLGSFVPFPKAPDAVFTSVGMDSTWLGRLLSWNGDAGQLVNTGIYYDNVSAVVSGWADVSAKANGALRKDTSQTLAIDEYLNVRKNCVDWLILRNLIGVTPTVSNLTNGCSTQYGSLTVAGNSSGVFSFAQAIARLQSHHGVSSAYFNPSIRFRFKQQIFTSSTAFNALWWLGVAPTTSDPGAPDTAGVGFQFRSGLSETSTRECRLHIRTPAGTLTSSAWFVAKLTTGANVGTNGTVVVEVISIGDGYVYMLVNGISAAALNITSLTTTGLDLSGVLQSTSASAAQFIWNMSTTTIES